MNYNEKLFAFKSNWINVNGSNVHYIDEGSGPIILFSHAAIGSSFMYRMFYQRLSKQFRCIALDYPGFGLSEDPESGKVSVVTQSKLITRFIEKLDLRDVIVFGHDTGGPSVFHAAGCLPDRIKGLILTDTIIFPTKEYPKIHKMLSVVGSRVFRWINEQTNFLTFITVNKGMVSRKLRKEEKEEYYRFSSTKIRRKLMIQMLKSLRENPEFMMMVKHNFETCLNQKPILLMYGEKDPVKELGIPDRIQAMTPNSEFYTIRGESHFPHEGQYEVMTDIIYRWHNNIGINSSKKAIA